MSNPLFNESNKQNNNIIQQFNQFKNNFRGDPKAQVQQLLNSGRISQAQYDKAVQMAKMLQQFIK